MTPSLAIFLWGVGGSAAVEVVSIYQHLLSEQELPPRYSQVTFWVVRIFLALIGGGLAVAYNIGDKPLLAVNIGASTPLIIKSLADGIGSALPKVKKR